MSYSRHRGQLNHALNNYRAGCADCGPVLCFPPVLSTCTRGSPKYVCGRNSKIYGLRLFQSWFWRLPSQRHVWLTNPALSSGRTLRWISSRRAPAPECWRWRLPQKEFSHRKKFAQAGWSGRRWWWPTKQRSIISHPGLVETFLSTDLRWKCPPLRAIQRLQTKTESNYWCNRRRHDSLSQESLVFLQGLVTESCDSNGSLGHWTLFKDLTAVPSSFPQTFPRGLMSFPIVTAADDSSSFY